MLRYFYDLEFIEDGKTVDVISIGVVAEDGREYYAQNRDCKFRRASKWVRANVYPYLRYFDTKRLRPLDGPYDAPAARSVWLPREFIAGDLITFLNPTAFGKPELWGYYSAYDHVALCQFFGTMMDLPEGWPMWTHDLMQYRESLGLDGEPLVEAPQEEHNALDDARWNKMVFEWLQERAA